MSEIFVQDSIECTLEIPTHGSSTPCVNHRGDLQGYGPASNTIINQQIKTQIDAWLWLISQVSDE